MPSFASHLAEYLEVEGKGIILMKPGVGRLRESVEGEERNMNRGSRCRCKQDRALGREERAAQLSTIIKNKKRTLL